MIPSHIVQGARPQSGADVEWLPNDHILFVMPFKGVYEVNRDKEIVWSYETRQVSHDADRLPNGNTIIVWGWGERQDVAVREVDAYGKTVWSWYPKDHLKDEDIRHTEGGYTHTNAVSRLPNGNTLISVRNFDMVVEVDTRGDIIWSLSDVVERPHDPEVLPNGNILMTSPLNQLTTEVTRDGRVVWRFKQPRIIRAMRYNHVLPNGNVLLVGASKIVEITRAGDVVWELESKGVDVRSRSQEGWLYKGERVGR